jgi:hypothetical protein
MATKQNTRTALPRQLDPAVDLKITQLSNALVLIADGLDEITGVGQYDMKGNAALGFSNIVRMVGEDLHMLTAAAKEGA